MDLVKWLGYFELEEGDRKEKPGGESSKQDPYLDLSELKKALDF